MKESRYNYYLKDSDNVICLNGVTGKVFSISYSEYELLNKVLTNQQMREEFPEVTQRLIKSRFLVESDEAEIEHLRSMNRKQMKNSTYQLTLNPTQDCNFKCWYCYEDHPQGKMSSETIDCIKKFICLRLEKGDLKHFTLNWFGGEPLMYFNEIVYPLSLYVKQQLDAVNVSFCNSITTNGYLINDVMIERFSEIGLNFFQITIDGDRNTHDKIRNDNGKPSFDRIIENCIKLIQNSSDTIVQLRVNYTTKSIGLDYSEIFDAIPFELRKQIRVQFQRVWQTYEKEGNDSQVKIIIRNHLDKLKRKNFNVSYNSAFSIYRGCVCYADRINYANINYDGNVYRCTARNYIPEQALGSLNSEGEIAWNKSLFEEIDEKANFENALCLDCNYLPLCGGPCFSKRFDNRGEKENNCYLWNVDEDLETFIREHYSARMTTNIIE